jgi:hypothetical protein
MRLLCPYLLLSEGAPIQARLVHWLANSYRCHSASSSRFRVNLRRSYAPVRTQRAFHICIRRHRKLTLTDVLSWSMYVMKVMTFLSQVSPCLMPHFQPCAQPVPLASIKIKCNVINGVRWSAFSILLFRSLELLPEHVIVCVFADFVDHNLFQIV